MMMMMMIKLKFVEMAVCNQVQQLGCKTYLFVCLCFETPLGMPFGLHRRFSRDCVLLRCADLHDSKFRNSPMDEPSLRSRYIE